MRVEICLFLVENTQNIPYVSKCLFIYLGSEMTASARDVGSVTVYRLPIKPSQLKEARGALFLRGREKGSMNCESKIKNK